MSLVSPIRLKLFHASHRHCYSSLSYCCSEPQAIVMVLVGPRPPPPRRRPRPVILTMKCMNSSTSSC